MDIQDLREYLEENNYTIEYCIKALRMDDDDLLNHVSESSIEYYADRYLDMVKEDYIDLDRCWEKVLEYNYPLRTNFPSMDDTFQYMEVLWKLEEEFGYLTLLDRFEEFKNNF